MVAVPLTVNGTFANADVEGMEEGDVWDPGLDDRGNSADRNMIIFTAVGGAALVTGSVLFFLGRRPERAPVVGAIPFRDGAGLAVTGRF
jgi:hypothetical protein